MLPGLAKVRRRASGRVYEYWYAYRGGPCILKASAASEAALDREVARLAPKAVADFQAAQGGERDFLHGLITAYLKSPAYKKLAPRTQRDRKIYLDKAREKFGDMRLKYLEAKGARRAFTEWRDEFAATPKSADMRLSELSAVLTWAVDEEIIPKNPLKGFTRIYSVDRSMIIWTPDDIEALRPHCDDNLWNAVQLATHCAARLGDLRRMTWSSVGERALSYQTGKSNGRRTAIVPITPGLRKVLDGIKRTKAVTILTSGRGRPWTEPGLESALQRAKREAGIEGLRWHDMRGTAATNLIRAGMQLDDLATVLGWSREQVEEIARRYVSADVMAEAMLDRLDRNKAATEIAKKAAKTASGTAP